MTTRWLRVLVVASVLAAAIAVEIKQTTTHIEVSDACKNLTPDNWFWWRWYGCGGPTAGGGDSGAG
jgi:hypothetical protein